MAELRVDSFSGGLTDFTKGSNPDQAIALDNLLINRAMKAYSRPGSVLFDTANPSIASGNPRVCSLWNFDQDTALIAQSARKVYRYNSGWSALTGPTGNDFFSAGATTARVSGSEWKGHLFLTNTESALPMKLYRDSGGTYRSVTAGLPKFLETNAYSSTTVVTTAIRDLANDIKAKFVAHYASAGIHAVADTVSGTFITASDLVAGDSLTLAITMTTQLMSAYQNHFGDAAGGYSYHADPTNMRTNSPSFFGFEPGQPNIALSTSTAPTTWLQVAQMLNELKTKYNWHTRGFNLHSTNGSVVAVSDLASTETGPKVSAALPPIFSLVNTIKSVFNAHANGVNHFPGTADDTGGSYTTAFAGQAAPIIGSSDASDFNTTVELAMHIVARYRHHQADAATPVYSISAGSGTTHKDRLSGIFTFSSILSPGTPAYAPIDTVITVGALSNYFFLVKDVTGWYVDKFSTGGYYGGNFAKGTRIADPRPSFTDNPFNYTLFTQTLNDGSVSDMDVKGYYISNKVLHSVDSNEQTGVNNMTPAIYDYNLLSKDLNYVFASMRAIAENINYHVPSTKYHYANGPSNFIRTEEYPNYYHVYNYAFVYARSYTTIAGENFLDRSAPLFRNVTAWRPYAKYPIPIASISSIANSSTGNYDTTNTKVEIYRTIDNGQTYYYVDSIPNGTATYSDTVSDDILVSREKLYTNDGILANDPPPLAKYLHILQNGLAYYGYVTQTLDTGATETVPNRVLQAVQDDPDSVPGGNFIDLAAPVAGLSSARTIPLSWTADGTYRLEGSFNERGQGAITAVAISERIGLKASSSPVQVDGGVVFAGPDQFYFTDGYKLVPIGAAWPTTYATLVSTSTRAGNILGTYDKLANMAWFGASYGGAENDKTFTLHLEFPFDPRWGGTWTTGSNGTSYAPTALCMFNGQLIRGDSRGYVFKHASTYTSDPKVDIATTPSGWAFKTITYDYTSVAFNFGDDLMRKWASVIEAKFENLGDLSIQISAINDLGRNTKNVAAIRSRSVTGEIDEKRYFSAGGLWFTDKQIRMTNAKVIITNSDTLGTATLVHAAKTLTLASGSYPTDMIDHVMSLDNDSYVKEYTISVQAGGVITVTDPDNALPVNGVYKWVIRGYPKTEKMQLNAYTLFAELLGVNQSTAAGESAENA